MSRHLVVAVLSIFVMLLTGSAAEGEENAPPGDSPSAAVVSGVTPPVHQGKAAAEGVEPRVAALEREAVEEVGKKYARRIRDLNQLALQTKGMELLAIHQQIEALKIQQAHDELEARMKVALESGDLERLRQLEQVSERTVGPRPVPAEDRELRPAPAPVVRGGDR